MRRFLGVYAAILLVLAAGVLWPLWWPFDPVAYTPKPDEPSVEQHAPAAAAGDQTIHRFDTDLTVDADGTLHAVERITIDVTSDDQHGIYRFFDQWDENIRAYRVEPDDVTVTVDGATPETTDWRARAATMERGHEGRFVTYRIGDPDTLLPQGEHTYELRYDWRDVLSVDGPTTRFVWDVLPGGVGRIDAASVVVTLPGAASGVTCAVGWDATDGCTATAATDGRRLTIPELGRLAPDTPVTIGADVAVPAPAGAEPVGGRPASDPRVAEAPKTAEVPAHVRAFGRDPDRQLPWWLLTALLLPLPVWLYRLTREKNPPFPLLYEPPSGIGPGQAAYILNETTSGAAFSGSVLYAAERGLLTLENDGDSWRTADRKADWSSTDEVTRELKPLDNGVDFSDSDAIGPVFHEFARQVPRWAVREGWMTKEKFPRIFLYLHGLVLSLALAATGYRIAVHEPTIAALLPGVVTAGALALMLIHGRRVLLGAIVLCALSLATFFFIGYTGEHPVPDALRGARIIAFLGLMAFHFWLVKMAGGLIPRGEAFQRRTEKGRELWTHVGGFARALGTESAEARFDFAARKDAYAAYLPWAVAFGVADAWARKFHAETGEVAPVPAFLPGTFGGDGPVPPTHGLGGFDGPDGRAFGASVAAQADAAISQAIGRYAEAHPVEPGPVFRSGTFDWGSGSSGGSGGGGSSGGGGGGGGGVGRW